LPDDFALFRAEMRDVEPQAPVNRVEPQRARPAPVPAKSLEDERAVLHELARLASDDDDTELEDDWAYLRPGLPRESLRKLRRTQGVIQDQGDVQGLTGDGAALAMAGFLADCRRRGVRCVRIVHGKGLRSRGREPVLKRRIRRLLTRRDEVLAFVEPRAIHGGSGAVVALLEA